MRRQQTRAPHVMECLCGKWYSPTKSAAKQLRQEVANHKQAEHQIRYYECDHGGHHWTRRETWAAA